MSKKYLLLSIAMVFLMLLPMMMYPVSASTPTNTGLGGAVQNPNWLIEDTLNGGGPATVDPAAAYDTASRELIQNAYDTLIMFDGEQCGNIPNSGVSNEYLPGLATQVTVGPPATLATVGPSASGVSPAYTNFTVYFTIRGTNQAGTGTVPFQTWSRSDISPKLTWPQYYLTAQDVAYSFDRLLVHAYAFEGVYWLVTDALFLQDYAWYNNNLTSATFTTMLENAVQYNNTCCWFNIPNIGFAIGTQAFTPVSMFNSGGSWNTNFWTAAGALPIDYPLNTFFQVWAQQCASIVSYDWTVNWLNPYLYTKESVTDTLNPPSTTGYPVPTGDEIEWTFGPTTGGGDPQHPTGVPASNDWNNWTDYYNPWLPIYDEVDMNVGSGGVTCGTGPYILEVYYPTSLNGYYIMNRFVNYWGGWPASWPNPPYPPQPASDCKPEGWVDYFMVQQKSSICGLGGEFSDLIQGSADFVAYAPMSDMGASGIFTGSPYTATSPLYIDDPTIAGVQCDYPIPTFQTESFFMNQNITVGNTQMYGEIDNPNVWTGTGIPSNFFADINIRKMFAWCLNETFCIQIPFLDRAYQPFTCAPDGFAYINTSQQVYSINLNQAYTYMLQANADSHGQLLSKGFTLDLIYFGQDDQAADMMGNLAEMIDSLNNITNNFHVTAQQISLGTQINGPLTLWNKFMGYPFPESGDAQFPLPTFLDSYFGDYSSLQDFMFQYMDSAGMYAQFTGYSNPTVNALLQQTAYTNNAAVLTADYGQLQQIYYNDVPSVTLLVPIGTGFQRDWVQGHYYNPLYPGIYAYNLWKYNAIPGDVNRDGKVDMSDVIDVNSKAFGSYYGQFGTGGSFLPIMSATWNFYCDVIGTPRQEWTDRTINEADVVMVLTHFGQVDTPTGSIGGPNDKYNGVNYWNGAWNETAGWYGYYPH